MLENLPKGRVPRDKTDENCDEWSNNVMSGS